MILDKSGVLALSTGEIDFSEFEKIDEIEAYSLVPKGDKFKKVKADNFATSDAEATGGTFVDGRKITTFRFSGLQIGAIRYLKYESTMTKFDFPFGNSFYSYYPENVNEFIIDTDSAIHLNVKPFFAEKLAWL